eukprot:gene10720-biopygen22837
MGGRAKARPPPHHVHVCTRRSPSPLAGIPSPVQTDPKRFEVLKKGRDKRYCPHPVRDQSRPFFCILSCGPHPVCVHVRFSQRGEEAVRADVPFPHPLRKSNHAWRTDGMAVYVAPPPDSAGVVQYVSPPDETGIVRDEAIESPRETWSCTDMHCDARSHMETYGDVRRHMEMHAVTRSLESPGVARYRHVSHRVARSRLESSGESGVARSRAESHGVVRSRVESYVYGSWQKSEFMSPPAPTPNT